MSNIDNKQQSQTNFSFLHQEILCQKKKQFQLQTVDLDTMANPAPLWSDKTCQLSTLA